MVSDVIYYFNSPLSYDFSLILSFHMKCILEPIAVVGKPDMSVTKVVKIDNSPAKRQVAEARPPSPM